MAEFGVTSSLLSCLLCEKRHNHSVTQSECGSLEYWEFNVWTRIGCSGEMKIPFYRSGISNYELNKANYLVIIYACKVLLACYLFAISCSILYWTSAKTWMCYITYGLINIYYLTTWTIIFQIISIVWWIVKTQQVRILYYSVIVFLGYSYHAEWKRNRYVNIF